MRERSEDELELALDNAGELFERVRREMDEHGEITAYPAGPWHAGLEPFPAKPGSGLAELASLLEALSRRAGEAQRLREVAPRRPEPALVGQLEAADQPVRHERPGVVRRVRGRRGPGSSPAR